MTNPGMACIVGRHLLVEVYDDDPGLCVASWCLWCGTAANNPHKVTSDGQAVGFIPDFRVRVPAGFHRQPDDT
jgi:hypothetical protein